MANKNRIKSNSKNTRAKSAKTRKPFLSGLKKFLADRRTHKITGLFFMLLAAYCLIAFTSFLFTWKNDQSLISGRSWWQVIFGSESQAENWLGKLGALVSHTFIHNWFGISSFIFVLLFFLVGYRIVFKTNLMPLAKTFVYAFLALLILSPALAFLFGSQTYAFMGGGFGYEVATWLTRTVGSVGTGILIFFVLISFFIAAFNPRFGFLKSVAANFNSAKPALATSREAELKHFEDTIGQQDNFTSDDMAEEELADEMDDTDEDPFRAGSEPEDEEDTEEIELELTTAEDSRAKQPETTEPDESDEDFSVETAPPDKELSDSELDQKLQEYGEYDPTLDLASYQHPKIELLQEYGTGKVTVSKEELEENKDKIVTTLGNYKIGIEKIKATIGPTVTLYEIVPEPGVRISKIKNLEDDIALSLAALGIRIIAPIPGKGTIGIEVPNSNPDVVSMRSVVASEKFQNSGYDLPIVLGKTISNETFVTDLAKMPHLLMAGATGQGKSVGLNAILVSLLYKKHPAQIKFVLVDPKKVELTLFNKIERHFLAKLPDEEEAIITDTSKVVKTLNSLCIEMDQRYELLKEAQVRNIKEYNAKFIKRRLNPEKGHRFLPYIVLVVDEFADLIMTAGKEVEMPIARLAQLARAIGIHLIIATQRPSVNIITGTIKANFPARIAFRVTSKIDSRTILDAGGADQLIGRGDMLMSTGSDLIRLQCAFVDTPEVAEITDFIGNQRAYPSAFELPEVQDESGEGGGGAVDLGDRDEMFEEAARLIVVHQQGSTSLIQRKLKLGYNRAGRIVDQLEAAGIVGPFEGSKARQVLIPDEYSLEQLLRNESQNIEN